MPLSFGDYQHPSPAAASRSYSSCGMGGGPPFKPQGSRQASASSATGIFHPPELLTVHFPRAVPRADHQRGCPAPTERRLQLREASATKH